MPLSASPTDLPTDPASLSRMFRALAMRWPTIDFAVQCVAFSDKNELRGRYAETTREKVTHTMLLYCC